VAHCFVWRNGDAYDVEIVDYHKSFPVISRGDARSRSSVAMSSCRSFQDRGLIYCTAALFRQEQDQIVPGLSGWEYLPDRVYADDAERTAAMVQNALICAIHHPQWSGSVPSAFIKEGR